MIMDGEEFITQEPPKTKGQDELADLFEVEEEDTGEDLTDVDEEDIMGEDEEDTNVDDILEVDRSEVIGGPKLRKSRKPKVLRLPTFPPPNPMMGGMQ